MNISLKHFYDHNSISYNWGADPLHFHSVEGGEEEVLGEEVGVLTLRSNSSLSLASSFGGRGQVTLGSILSLIPDRMGMQELP